jgi:hypothetical protein
LDQELLDQELLDQELLDQELLDQELLRSGTFAGRFAPKAVSSQLMSARGQERSKTATSTSQQRII